MKLCNCSVCVTAAVIRWLCLYCYSILSTNHVWRGSCGTRSRQWLWNVQGWVCGRWCTPGSISINCWPTKASGKLSLVLECQEMQFWELNLYLGPVSFFWTGCLYRFLQIHYLGFMFIVMPYSQSSEGCTESHFYNLPGHSIVCVASDVAAMVLRATVKEPLCGHCSGVIL